jgi:pimeloyl-ACP methyl ester carboxylesterase
MSVTTTMVPTSHAGIAIAQSSGSGLPVLLIHGNSSAKEVFRGQLNGPLGAAHRLIAIDLPGHGASSDAVDPKRTYSMPGYAEAVIEVVTELGVDRAVVYGWSLGGHVALEMLPRWPGVVGLALSAAPPVTPTPEGIQAGFKPNPLIGLLGQEKLGNDEMNALAQACYGKSLTEEMARMMRRTDGRARAMMFAGLFSGAVSDQKTLAEKSPVPIAMVNGAEDPFVNVDYIASLSIANLWDKHAYLLRGAGHAAFLDAPAKVDAMLSRFVAEAAARAPSVVAKRPSKRRSGAAA